MSGQFRFKAYPSLLTLLLLTCVATNASTSVSSTTPTEKLVGPNGVQSLDTYESRIGEPGLLIEDENIQMWVPKVYEEHSHVIFAYLKTGYQVLSDMFGEHEMPVKFSVEHYPPNTSYWRGTDKRGAIRFGYSNC